MSDQEAHVSSAAGAKETEIDFETWTDLSARMLKMDQEARFDLLEEREIDAGDFARAEQRWVMALSDDLSAEKMDRVDLYAARCAEEMQRRKEPREQPATVAVKAMVEITAPAPIEVARPSAPALEEKESVAPFVGAPVSLFAMEPPMTPASPWIVSASAPLGPALATVTATPSPPAPVGILASPPVVRAPAHLSGTMMTSESLTGALPAAAALPFGQAPSAEFVGEMSAPRAGASEATVGGATLPLGVDLLGKMRKELPFMKAASAVPVSAPAAPAPRLTLDTYASLCAELSVAPERAQEILKKYGIGDEAARRGVDREWGERLSTHPETQILWQRKVTEFRAWLVRGGQ